MSRSSSRTAWIRTDLSGISEGPEAEEPPSLNPSLNSTELSFQDSTQDSTEFSFKQSTDPSSLDCSDLSHRSEEPSKLDFDERDELVRSKSLVMHLVKTNTLLQQRLSLQEEEKAGMEIKDQLKSQRILELEETCIRLKTEKKQQESRLRDSEADGRKIKDLEGKCRVLESMLTSANIKHLRNMLTHTFAVLGTIRRNPAATLLLHEDPDFRRTDKELSACVIETAIPLSETYPVRPLDETPLEHRGRRRRNEREGTIEIISDVRRRRDADREATPRP